MPLNLGPIPNSATLLAALAKVDITVPPRTQGRTSDHCETFVASHLLAALADSDRLAFPLSVAHQDRPDIRLGMAGETVGIEITEAVSTAWADFMALAEREKPDALLEPAHFGFDALPRTLDEKRALLKQPKLSSGGWVGDRPEQEWAKFMYQAVHTKLQKLSVDRFEKFSKNYLAIYDNLPLVSLNEDKITSLLRRVLAPHWSISPAFDAIYIQRGRIIIELISGGYSVLQVPDLWARR
jgi:hypothetical protein